MTMKFWQNRNAGGRFVAWLLANGVQTVDLAKCANCREAVVSLDDLPWIHAASILDVAVKCRKPEPKGGETK